MRGLHHGLVRALPASNPTPFPRLSTITPRAASSQSSSFSSSTATLKRAGGSSERGRNAKLQLSASEAHPASGMQSTSEMQPTNEVQSTSEMQPANEMQPTLPKNEFFSVDPPLLELMRPKGERPDADCLLSLIDRAIYLSRAATHPQAFASARAKLRAASQVFFQIVRSAREKDQEVDVGYEIFVLRSGWIQVVRTTLALEGDNEVEGCALMMGDYLEWEKALMDSGVKAKDGTEELPTPEAKGKGPEKMYDERYFYGPFIQDTAPVLYDIFSNLTRLTKKEIQDRSLGHSFKHLRRGYIGGSKFKTASRLWSKIVAIPPECWKKPMSLNWMHRRDSTAVHDCHQLIGLCSILHGRALRTSCQWNKCFSLWKDVVRVFLGASQDFPNILMRELTNSLSTTKNVLVKGKAVQRFTPNWKARRTGSLNFFETANSLAILLSKDGIPFEREGGWRLQVMPDDLDGILYILFSLDKVLQSGRQKGSKEEEDRIRHLVSSSNGLLRNWIEKWLDEKGVQRVQRYRPSAPSSCHRLFEKLLFGSLGFAPSLNLALRFLSRMVEDPDIPEPDKTIYTILLRHKSFGREELASREGLGLFAKVMQSGDDVTATDRETTGMDKGEDDLPAAPVNVHVTDSEAKGRGGQAVVHLLLLSMEHAMRNGDRSCLLFLVEVAYRLIQRRLLHFDPATLAQHQGQHLRFAIPQIVFHLYPSLNIKKKRYLVVRGQDGREQTKGVHIGRKRSAQATETAFHPEVLVEVLRLVTYAGKTGLAERMWRMIKRASLRAKKEQGDSKMRGWPIPIRAYTLMNQLYASEVRKGYLAPRGLRGKTTPKKSTVVGWGYIRSGPHANTFLQSNYVNRAVAARAIARREYGDLEARWEEGRAEKANAGFWHSLLAVFKVRGRSKGKWEIKTEADAVFVHSIQQRLEEEYHQHMHPTALPPSASTVYE